MLVERNYGTIFLDEIGEMPLSAQAKLLRALQEQTIRRVGGTSSIQINVRAPAATSKDLKALVQQQPFREDLYYRINGVVITLPPMRERPEDILALGTHFFPSIASSVDGRSWVDPWAPVHAIRDEGSNRRKSD